MVKIMENPIKIDDLGVAQPYFWFNTHMQSFLLDSPFDKFSGPKVHQKIHQVLKGSPPPYIWNIPIYPPPKKVEYFI